MAQNATNNFPMFEISTLQDLRHEYRELVQSTARTVDLTASEKFILYMHPLFRRSLRHQATLLIYLLVAYFVFCSICAGVLCWCESKMYRYRQQTFTTEFIIQRSDIYEEICDQFGIKNCNKTFLSEVFNKYDAFLNEHSEQVKHEVAPWPWSWFHSLGFVIWCFATIGDGKMYPLTTSGRILCIALSVFGIPLFLLVIGNYGREINTFLASIIYQQSTKPNDSPALIENSVNLVVHGPKLKTLFINNAPRMKLSEASNCVNFEMFGRSRQVTNMKYQEPQQQVQEKNDEVPEMENESEISNEPSSNTYEDTHGQSPIFLPMKIALIIICVYMSVGVFILMEQTKWEFIDTFYYLFITFTTIGIGDKDPWNVMTIFHYLYIFFGLILTAMVLESLKDFIANCFKRGMSKIFESANILWLDGEILMIPYNSKASRSLKNDDGFQTCV